MLRRDEDALDLDRRLPSVLVELVADRDLRLAVGTQVADLAGAAHAREALADAVREDDRHRHQLGRLARRVAEHHPLVARADLVDRIDVAGVVLHLVRRVDALRDVGRLRVDRDDDAARVRVEAELGVRVADPADRLPNEVGDVDVRLGRHLARDDDEPGRDERLAGDAAVAVVAQHRVEDCVGDLVGDLVRMAFRDGLGREEELARGHSRQVTEIAHSPVGLRPMSPSATSASCTWPSSTAQTPSVIGISMPRRRARSRSTGAVVSPSTV